MKHFEPLMTYLSPIFTAVVRIPDTSEPASGSVRQNEASLNSSVSMPRYFCLTSSDPPRATPLVFSLPPPGPPGGRSAGGGGGGGGGGSRCGNPPPPPPPRSGTPT